MFPSLPDPMVTTPSGPLDRLPDFLAFCPVASEAAKPERSEMDATLLEYARVVTEALARVDAGNERLSRDTALTLTEYEKVTREAQRALHEAQAAAAELLEAGTELGGRRTAVEERWRRTWHRRREEEATLHLQKVLAKAAATQICVCMRAHLAARGKAKVRVRAALERQILLANPEARDAGLEHLTEDALQAFVEERSVGRRTGELLGSARRLREVEQTVAELRHTMAQFAMVVEAQSELVGRAGRSVEAANLAVHTAAEELELAKESHDVYQRAKWMLILGLVVIVFVLGGGLGSLPEWLAFLRGKSGSQVRGEAQALEPPSPAVGPDVLAMADADNLAGLLADKDPVTRRTAAEALGMMGRVAAERTGELAALLADEDAGVRKAAADALATVGPAAAEHAGALAGLLADKPLVQLAAARALGQMGPAAAEHAGALVGLLADQAKYLRLAAAKALGQMGPAAAEHAGALAGLPADRDAEVRMQVAWALAQMGLLDAAGTAEVREAAVGFVELPACPHPADELLAPPDRTAVLSREPQDCHAGARRAPCRECLLLSEAN